MWTLLWTLLWTSTVAAGPVATDPWELRTAFDTQLPWPAIRGSDKKVRALGRTDPSRSTLARQGSRVDVRLGIIEHDGRPRRGIDRLRIRTGDCSSPGDEGEDVRGEGDRPRPQREPDHPLGSEISSTFCKDHHGFGSCLGERPRRVLELDVQGFLSNRLGGPTPIGPDESASRRQADRLPSCFSEQDELSWGQVRREGATRRF
jgi:hypothetical protein